MKIQQLILSFLLIASNLIQPVVGLDANNSKELPNIDGIFSNDEWSNVVENKKILHFTWFGGEFYVNSSWYALWDDDTVFLAILYDRRPDVEKIREIIELDFDCNNNGELDDGEIGFAALYQDEGAQSPNMVHEEFFGFYEVRPPGQGWELLEDSNLGRAFIKKSDAHVVFEIAFSKEVSDVNDMISFRYRINSYMYGETEKIFDNINIKSARAQADQIGIPGFPYVSIILGLLMALIFHPRNQC